MLHLVLSLLQELKRPVNLNVITAHPHLNPSLEQLARELADEPPIPNSVGYPQLGAWSDAGNIGDRRKVMIRYYKKVYNHPHGPDFQKPPWKKIFTNLSNYIRQDDIPGMVHPYRIRNKDLWSQWHKIRDLQEKRGVGLIFNRGPSE
jgi:hypothetical protein